ncbi:bifunctional 3,4-dihydroxy-2-butanone-4-phosphate synthase/GTP cyclohydrolase II [Clostridium fermenticellae]|uniref:Riboflavin biosynthesis protein RibBA n=1 Tax=Clostridium fermenticellae TaxID=2068654 RepID=A0A386H5T6_9CLOT|nr:bifunctional 3,4-dihydroxy-2-butanone-4-phosphate synthase/GTP cyclohydrolase II [Clostridium fermenticellae]AYD40928.1 bifunctional 3,4-dihydroxy-2-butanone-4-phosphate synthase/GTP cyclohydrolase II [Clostridium fermenticellae]
MSYKFNSIEEAIVDIREGKMVVVVDDENRENEGDLIIAADKVTHESINFMSKYARGLICVPMDGKRLEHLGIEHMVEKNTDNFCTAFTVSVDADSTTTGISAFDRALTVQKLISADSKPQDFRKPGHMFPLKAKEGGVLVRTGHTEAAVDLSRLAGLSPAGVICEIMKSDGTMARVPELMEFVCEHGLKIITVADLAKYRIRTEKLVKKVVEAKLPTKFGDFKIIAYESTITHEQHIALVKGDKFSEEDTLVRIHSECFTGDVLHSLRCDCGDQLIASLKQIDQEGKGVLLYLDQEGRGIGLINKLKAYVLQEQGMDTVEANIALGFKADLRDYSIAYQILKDLGVTKVRLMTNNPKKIIGLSRYGIDVTERVPVQVEYSKQSINYMKTKKEKMGHILSI